MFHRPRSFALFPITLMALCTLAAGIMGCRDRSAPRSGTATDAGKERAGAGNAPVVDKRSLAEIRAGLPKADVGGSVIDPEGRPAADAEVFLYYASGGGGALSRLAARTRTGPDGSFRFARAMAWEPQPAALGEEKREPPKYAVIARDAQGRINFRILLQGEPAERVRIPLGKKETTTSRITAYDGERQPLPGVRLWPKGLWIADYDTVTTNADHIRLHLSTDIGLSSGTTAQDGGWETSHGPVLEMQPWFRAEKEGYGSRESGGGLIVLVPAAQVTGKVTWPDGSPAAEVAVQLTNGVSMGTSYERSMLTGPDGGFRFDDVWATPGKKSGEQQAAGKANAGKEITLTVEDPRPGSRVWVKPMVFNLVAGERVEKNIQFTQGCRVTGKVMDHATSRTLAGVVIRYWTRGESGQLRTGADGRFSLVVNQDVQLDLECQSIEDDRWQLGWSRLIASPGNENGWRRIYVEHDMEVTIEAALRPMRKLSGQVIDEQGRGVPDMMVTALSYYYPTAHTDRAGSFTLNKVPADRPFDLAATEWSDQKNWYGIAHVTPASEEVKIHLERRVDWVGRVTDQYGRPVARLQFSIEPWFHNGAVTTTTNAAGWFTVRGVCPRVPYRAMWNSGSYQRNSEQNPYILGGETTITLPMPLLVKDTGSSLTQPIRFTVPQYSEMLGGRIVDARTGQPIPGCWVQVSQSLPIKNTRNEELSESGFVGEQGYFWANRLDRGMVRVRAHASNSQDYEEKEIEVAAGRRDVVVALEPTTEERTLIYRVQVTDEAGKPVAGAQLAMHVIDRKTQEWVPELPRAATDAGGSASLTWIRPQRSGDRYLLSCLECDAPGYDRYYRGVFMDKDFTMSMRLRKAGEPLRGIVTDEQGQPIRGALVSVILTHPEGVEERRYGYVKMERNLEHTTATCDGAGRFELPRFNRRDRIALEVTAPGFAKGEFTAARDSGTAEESFKLKPACTLRGRVELAGGISAGKMTAETRAERGGSVGWQSAPVGADGRFGFNQLAAGSYRIWIRQEYPLAPGVQQLEFDDLASDRKKPVKVQPGKSAEVVITATPAPLLYKVTGRITDLNNALLPLSAFSFQFNRGPDSSRVVDVRSDGTWETSLPEGRYTTRIVSERGVPGRKLKEAAEAIEVTREEARNQFGLTIFER